MIDAPPPLIVATLATPACVSTAPSDQAHCDRELWHATGEACFGPRVVVEACFDRRPDGSYDRKPWLVRIAPRINRAVVRWIRSDRP